MNAETLAALSDELAALSRAGLPLDRGLAALSTELGGDAVGRACRELSRQLAAGRPIDEAMTLALKGAPPHVAALVRSGVISGKLAESLTRLGEHSRLRLRLSGLILDALFYPGLVLAFGLCIFAFLGTFVIPRFISIFADFGMRLPWMTQVLFTINEYAVMVYLVVPASLVGTLLLLRWVLLCFPAGRKIWWRFTGAIPIWGNMQRQIHMSLFYDLLGLLIIAEVPLHEALRLSGSASPDPLLTDAANAAAADIEAGKLLEPSLLEHHLGTPWAAWIAGVGASQGKLAPQLELLRETAQRQAEWRARWLHAVLPSVLLVFIGAGFIGLFLLSLFMPMFQLLNGLSS